MRHERGMIEMFNRTETTAESSSSRATGSVTWQVFACMLLLIFGLAIPGALAYADDAAASPGDSSGTGAILQTGAMSETPAKRTIMLYVCGADLEEDAGMASINLGQVLNADFGKEEDVHVVVMTGGSFKWHLAKKYLVFPEDVEVPDDAVQNGNPLFDDMVETADDPKSQISGPYNQIWEAKSKGAVESPGKLVLLDGDGLKNHRADTEGDEEWTSAPETLKGFVDYSVKNFPAEKYDLILWDHGGGTTGGFALDNRRQQLLFGANTMSFSQIIGALKNNKVVDKNGDGKQDATFDFVNFDACLMGSTEITLAIADYTDHYIASPEIVPGRGQLYKGWLELLRDEPSMDASKLGKKLVDDFVAYYDAGYKDGTRQEGTMASINTKALLESDFVQALSAIGDALKTQVESGRFYDELRSAKSSIKYADNEFYDLGNLVSHLGVSLWELDPDAVTNSAIDYSNDAYTAAAKTVLGILANPDIVYARNTAGINKESRFFMNADGSLAGNTLESSGLHLYFPLSSYELAIKDYDAAIEEAIALMPKDDRRTFLKKYVQTMYEYNLIRYTGRSVTNMINSGFKREDIDYSKLVEYWHLPEYPGVKGLEQYNAYNFRVKDLYRAMDPDGDASRTEASVKTWLDRVVKLQAREAVSADNVSALSFVTRNGTGSKVQIDNTRRRAVDNVRCDVMAELPAARAYIEEHDKKIDDPDYSFYYMVETGEANLPLGSVNATMDASLDSIDDSTGNFLSDYVKWFNTATSTIWNVDPLPRSWYAVKDADGNLHVANNEDASLTTTVPMIRMRKGQIGDNPELNLLGFTDGKLTQIYLHDEEGNAKTIKASDLKTEIELMPALYIDSIVPVILPASKTPFKVTPDNIGEIKLVYTDIDNIEDIEDVDGDSDVLGFKYSVDDIYGASVDISDKVNNPEGTVIDIRLAKVERATYTGEELSPVVTYNGTVLEEGVDYTLDNDSGKPFVEPGEYDITLFGAGDYVDMLITTFVIDPAENNESADRSPSSSEKSTTGAQAGKSGSSTTVAQTGGSASTIAKTGDPLQAIAIAVALVVLAAGSVVALSIWRRSRNR